MPRRIHVTGNLSGSGPIELDRVQAHHARNVLRLKTDDPVELFDDAGNTGDAVIAHCDADRVVVTVRSVQEKQASSSIVIASAVPKGDRADWMIEKLSELGVSRFIPLATARSVVLPAGQNKRDRWVRIATESAKQSRRSGVMQIDELTPLEKIVRTESSVLYLSTKPDAPSILSASSLILHPSSFVIIGPEGGWTDEEIALFQSAGLTGVKLTATILRVETAAVAAAAVVACLLQQRPRKIIRDGS